MDDGLSNALTGLGELARDSRTASDWTVEQLSQDQLEAMYRQSDTAATIVDEPVNEMFRRGFDLLVGEDEKSRRISADVMSYLDETDFLERLREAMCWARAYGGAANFIGADDGLDPAEPLQEDRIKKFDSLTTLTPRELRPVAWEQDLKSPRYGQPTHYEVRPATMPVMAVGESRLRIQAQRQVVPSAVLVHHTRLIRFDGVRVSRKQSVMQADSYGWGDSVLQRPRWLIRDFDTAWQATARILMTFSVPKYKMVGLNEMLDEEDSSRALWTRINNLKRSMVATGVIVMDKDEEVDIESTSVAGLDALLQQMAIRLSAAARMPVTVLMGQSPAGLNATGASDVRNWYAKVAAEQKKTLEPALKRVLKLLFLSQDGPTAGAEPEDWRVKFRPLWEMDEAQAVDIRLKQAQADEKYITNSVLSPEEVAVSRFGGAEYSTETVIDAGARKTEGGAPPPPDPEAEAQAAAEVAAARTQASMTNGAAKKQAVGA